jgi:hypothetical protein
VFVNLPVGLAFYNSSAISCTIQNTGDATSLVSTACSFTNATDTRLMGYYVKTITATMKCSVLDCSAGASFTFTVGGAGLLNAFSNNTGTSGTITVGTTY